MKTQAVLVGLGLAVMTLGTGCASFHARTSRAYKYKPHSYPAWKYTWDDEGLCERYEPAYLSRPGPFGGGGARQRSLGGTIVVSFAYMGGFLVYAAVVETPISLVTDTVLYPYDRLRMRHYARSAATFKEMLLDDAWPATPRTLRRHYWPRTCDSVVAELLRSPDTPDFHEKILRLLDADLAVRVIAEAVPLDNELVLAVFDAVVGDSDIGRIMMGRLFDNGKLTKDTELLRMLVETGGFTIQIASGGYLDNELATAVIEQALIPPVNRTALYRLSQNPHAPPTVLQRLLELDNPDMLLTNSILRNPATPTAILRAYSGDARFWPSLLSNTNTPSDVLEIVRSNEKNGHRVALIVTHPNATGEQVVRIIEAASELTDVSDWDRNNLIHEGRIALLNRPGTPADVLAKYVFQSEHNWVYKRLVEHPAADADLLLAVVTNANQRIESGNTHFVAPKLQAEKELAQRPAATAEQLALTASLTFRAQTLQKIVKHPNASKETLRMVVRRCDELIALIPTASDNWRVRNAGLCESILQAMRASVLRRMAAD